MLKDKFPNEYDELRKNLIDLLESKYKTENPDAYESGFLGYFIDSLSQLTLDSLFFSSLSYKEAFLNRAALPESVLSIAAQLSYNVNPAEPAVVDVLVSIPFERDGERLWNALAFTIEKNDEFLAKEIVYSIPYTVKFDFDYTITPAKLSLIKETDNLIEKVPYNFLTLTDNDTNIETVYLQFVVTVKQYQIKEHVYYVPVLQPLQFWNIDIPLENQFYKIEVFIKDPEMFDYEEWTAETSIFSLPLGSKSVAYTIFEDKIVLTFGNGIYGQQPKQGSSIKINIYETLGKKGKIIANKITKGPRYYDDSLNGNGGIVTYFVTNPVVSTDGRDKETIDEIRVNARDFARATNGLVSELNYKNIKAITKLPLQDSLAILKRSDLHANDIYTFLALTGEEEDTFVPTRSDLLDTTTSTTSLFKPEVTIEEYDYKCPYQIDINVNEKKAYYKYVLEEIYNVAELIKTTNLAKEYSVVLTGYLIKFDEPTNKFIFRVSYDYLVLDDQGQLDLSFAQDLSLQVEINGTSYTSTNLVTAKYFEFSVSKSDLEEGVIELLFNLSYKNDLMKVYKSSELFINDLSDILTSDINIDGSSITVYDVPLIYKPYYEIHKQWLDINVLQKLGYFSTTIRSYRMLTDNVYFKFANTHGRVKNILFNNLNSKTIKTYDFTDKFYLPLQIKLKVYIKQENMEKASLIVNTVKETLFNSLKSDFGFESSIYTSKIIKIVQNVENVEFCELIEPKDSLVYDYNKSDLSQDDMIKYVPEFISIDKNNILIDIVIDLDNN